MFTYLLRSIVRWLAYCISGLLILYVLACAVLFLFQDKLLFFPSSNVTLQDNLTHDPNIRTIVIKTDAGQTVGRAVGTGSCLVVYFGGNAENTDYLFQGQTEWMSGCIFASMNYRGYGASDGSPDEQNMHSDALRWFDEISLSSHPEKVVVIGRSLGTNVALYLANQRKVDKLVLVTPYDSIVSVAEAHYSIFPVRMLSRHTFYSDRIAPEIKIHILILLAEHDTVVPKKNSEHLIRSFQGVIPTIKIIPTSDHNTIINAPEYQSILDRFIQS